MANVIVVANQKGGVAKTTTALAIAPILESLGFRTLFIDLDAQCNSTDVYNAQTDGVNTIYDVIINRSASAEESIQKTNYGEIIAGDRLLLTAEVDLLKDAITGITRLKTALEPIQSMYDYIVIDTNPIVNRLLFNALLAANTVIIPTSADRFGLVGMSQILETIHTIASGPNPDLQVGGILLTRYKGSMRLERQVREELTEQAEEAGISLFDTTIRESVKIRESQAMCTPPNIYAPSCTSVKDYAALVQEIIGE